MDNCKTPLDELHDANAQEINEHRQREDEVGCFYRLMEVFDPNAFAAFVRAEADRGLTMPQIVDAIAQGLAYHIVAVSIMSTNEHQTYGDLVISAQKYAIAMMSGQHQVETVHIADGLQRECTVEGVFRGRRVRQ